jgi:hypothetical protein
VNFLRKFAIWKKQKSIRPAKLVMKVFFTEKRSTGKSRNMSVLSSLEKQRVGRGVRQFGHADQMVADIASYDFDEESVRDYDKSIKDEILSAIVDLRSMKVISKRPIWRLHNRRLENLATNSDDPIERDQAVWNLTLARGAECIPVLCRSIVAAPTQALAISGLLALQKVAHFDPTQVIDFLEELASGTDIELGEWAKLHLLEMAATLPGGTHRLQEPCSDREFRYEKGKVFDVTMPLNFHCHAFTKIGHTTLHTVISPAWFSVVFGHAMACLRHETYTTHLVLEKLVEGLHPDGSPHFEHFPFSGTTRERDQGVFEHNYWAELFRPYYTSGRTEEVSEKFPVIREVPMSFCRCACTFCPKKYYINRQPVPESVRGLFFGYGHIEPKVLLKRGLNLRAGDFQLSSKINPATGRPANTYFYGTFFGKMSDWDGDGFLDVNSQPTHCNASGQLDYLGDGSMQADPICPYDWLGKPQGLPACVLV